MAGFLAHVAQAKSNLDFLVSLNHIPNKWDWKVTASFYVAVHLMNAYLAERANMHYRTHKQVEDAIAPTANIEVMRVDGDTFASYMALKNLSRRSRYICNSDGSDMEQAQITVDKHFKKALHHLDVLLTWFSKTYSGVSFDKMSIVCPELTKDMTNFLVDRTKAKS